MRENYVGLEILFKKISKIREKIIKKKLTPFGTSYPAMIASDCKLLPLPITTGFILKVSLMHALKYGIFSNVL